MAPSDEELMGRCRDGDVAAFEALMTRHLRGVTIHLQRIVFDPDEAQDLGQDVFLKLYARRETYTSEGRFTTWLFRIATNAAIDHIRRRSRRRSVSLFATRRRGDEGGEEAELHETLADPGSPAPCDILSAQEEWMSLGSALGQLSDGHREVFEMRTVEGLDYRAIAERLGITPAGARSRMHAAKEEIRRHMGGGSG